MNVSKELYSLSCQAAEQATGYIQENRGQDKTVWNMINDKW